jgi:hypothetical protein
METICPDCDVEENDGNCKSCLINENEEDEEEKSEEEDEKSEE